MRIGGDGGIVVMVVIVTAFLRVGYVIRSIFLKCMFDGGGGGGNSGCAGYSLAHHHHHYH